MSEIEKISSEQLINDLNISFEEKNIVINTFSQTLELILKLTDLKKYSVQLTPELIKLLLNIIKSNPEFFNSFELIFSEILGNKKIDINNISRIIELVKELYKILYDLNIQDIKKGLNISSCELILNFIINVFLMDKISDKTEIIELLKKINDIISIGIDLITIRKVLKNNKKTLFSCLYKKI
jgi:hypothetical protein